MALLADAGGFIPPAMFLGACHSGAMVKVKDWDSLRASVREEGARGQPGFAGTALALVRAGVKQVVAMRHEVSDGYARRLARRVYRGMFAEEACHSVDRAVALARGELARDRRGGDDPVDHATPLVFGSESVRLVAGRKRSGQAGRRGPRPESLLPGGDMDRPRNFVGRGGELTRLRWEWLEPGDKPIALIQGLAGLGKTSLAAEAVHLWFGRFDYVFAFQAKGSELRAEGFSQRLDQRLVVVSKAYRERYAANELHKVYLAPGTEGLSQSVREDLLRDNLMHVLASDRVLLVLDNFETNLLTSGQCKDPAWDSLFATLADRLKTTQSRVLVTSRHRPAALGGKALWLPLGPLPMKEAALFFQGHAPLRELWYGDDAAKAVAKRILYVSRGHPLILGRIADLARGYYDKKHGLAPEGRQAITDALDRIEGSGYHTLPDLFAGVRSDKDRQEEHKYLNEVAISAVDLLIERVRPEARTLLWIVTRVSEPPTGDMIGAVLGSDPAQHLGELCGAGLLVGQKDDTYAFHELVAERAAAWMEHRPEERGGRTEIDVWKAYGKRYGAAVKGFILSGKREAGLEVGRRGIRYLVRARAFESLASFAGWMVTSTRDPSLLGPVIADLQTVAGEVPPGQARWTLRTNLADALDNASQSAEALPFYALAAEEAEAAEHWSHVGAIYHNWATALRTAGQLDRARETFLRSAQAKRLAGDPRVLIAGSELEALRVDVMQGRAKEALPAITKKLAEVRGWWARREKGEPVPEAPDGETLARTLVSGLDIAKMANLRRERWQACLDLLAEMERVERALGASEHERARTRFSTYSPLLNLGELAKAKTLIEDCLDIFRRADDARREAIALSALADVWNRLNDPHQAAAVARRALPVHERLPDPWQRAISHGNLAIHLHAAGSAAEASHHQLAALAYTLATGLDSRPTLSSIALFIHQSAAFATPYHLPRLADILSSPAFAPLRAFLAASNTDLAALQARIDAALRPIRP